MSYKAVWAEDHSKLNNVELIKLKKDGLDIITTITEKYAEEGYEAVSEEDRVLLKWAGIYEQKPRNGHFMMRVRINSGIMDTKQAHVIADVSHKYGRDIVKITTRGSIQFYWITLEHLPHIFKAFADVGLSTFESCGDCPRRIIGNPLAGIDRNELIDTTELVKQLNDFFLLNRDYSNLPRKYKISISSSIFNPAHKEINDLSFTPATKILDGKEVTGFNVWVGGGLSTKPYMARQLDIFARPQDVLKIATGVATIFRDYGYRENRQHARLKFLVEDWGIEKFKNELLSLTGTLPDQGEEKISRWNGSFFYGIHPQKQEGKVYLGLHVPTGFMDSESLKKLALLSDQYGDGKLRTTMSQNIILSGVDSSYVHNLLEDSVFQKFPAESGSFMQHMVACTGSEYCNLALVDTRERAKDIAQFLDEHFKDLYIRINLVGCPNSCGHTQIADIGLRGCLIKKDSCQVEAFDIFLGGALGPLATFGQKLQGRIAADSLNAVLLSFIVFFKDRRKSNESFHQFVARMGISHFQDIFNKYQ
ncbi:MAG TPA: nitrite/sulfite reductase [Clostridia bacterium]